MTEMDASSPSLAEWAGVYHYHRIGHDERPMELCADGTIMDSTAGAEQRWWITAIEGTPTLSIGGPCGELCRLRRDPDGGWRGRWLCFEKMPIELIPRSLQPLRSLEDRGGVPYARHRFHYISYAQLIADCHALARCLPPVRAVAGVPRSGLIPASMIALELNVPIVSLESLLQDEPLTVPIPRRGYGRRVQEGMILVVDDTSASGRQIDHLRTLIRHPVAYAAIYVENRPRVCVDYYQAKLPDEAQSYEWTMFHDDNNRHLLTDLDGVLCEDWTGGNEDQHPDAYREFLLNAAPRRIPSIPVRGIVTNRLERHRPETEAWLARHGIEYGSLKMSPHATFAARDRAGDSAIRKAGHYISDPTLRLFIESDDTQACEIFRLTGRPVFSIARNGIVS